MDTHVWTFLLIVALFSAVGYYLLKRYAAYHVNKKTQKMIEDFRREEGLDTEDKPVSVVEKELLADLGKKPSAPAGKAENTDHPKEKSGDVDE